MLALDPAIAMHRLAIEPKRCLVKQAPRRMHPVLVTKVEAEVDKLMKASSIPHLVRTVVPVKKKNGQLQVYIDFGDLKKSLLQR